jgi:hypothetical protein
MEYAMNTFYIRKSIGTGGDVLRELDEYQNPDNYYLVVDKSAYEEAMKYIRDHANNDNGIFDDDDRVKALRAELKQANDKLHDPSDWCSKRDANALVESTIKMFQEELRRVRDLYDKLKVELETAQYELTCYRLDGPAHTLSDKLKTANEALKFYANGSYVSTPHEYHKDTKFDAGRNKRYPNQVGEYGTTAREALKITEEK